MYRNEVIWRRYGAHNDVGQGSRHFGRVHDSLLYYVKTDGSTWQQLFTPLDPEYVRTSYRHVEPETGRRFRLTPLTGPGGAAKGNPVYEWRGHTRAWRYSRETMERLDAEGKLHYSKTGYVSQKLFLDTSKGTPVQDVWDDIPNLAGINAERLGYPTQKPSALLDRIVEATSNPGDVVLDPFCGCGTALVAAQKLDRRWVGIDVTYLSIAVMRARLKDTFGMEDVPVIGQPTEVEGARQLAQSPEGRYQFQWWALALVDAKPLGGVEKKGSDRGIDGLITFTDKNNELRLVVVSVKSGGVNSGMVRDLKGTLDRENASIGLFVTLEEPTKEMKLEASTAGVYHSDLWNRDYPKIQLLSIRELLEDGRKPELPPFVLPTYQQAEKIKKASQAEQSELFG